MTRRVVVSLPVLTWAVSSRATAAESDKVIFEPRGVTAQDSLVFVAGLIPFAWATVEFWRRIAKGQSFGTGRSSVVILVPKGDDQAKATSSPAVVSPAVKEAEDGQELRALPSREKVPGSRFQGRTVLSGGALATAYVLFALAGGTLLLALLSAVDTFQKSGVN